MRNESGSEIEMTRKRVGLSTGIGVVELDHVMQLEALRVSTFQRGARKGEPRFKIKPSIPGHDGKWITRIEYTEGPSRNEYNWNTDFADALSYVLTEGSYRILSTENITFTPVDVEDDDVDEEISTASLVAQLTEIRDISSILIKRVENT
jgi:hypothetical protein